MGYSPRGHRESDTPEATWHSTYIYIYIHIGASQVLLVVKNSPAKAGDLRDAGSIPGSGSPGRSLCMVPESGRSPGGGKGNLFQYSCLENPMDRGAWRATACGVTTEVT